MKIENGSEPLKLVTDYDINFANGSAISITIDPTTNDSADINYSTGIAQFYLGPKPSYNPEQNLPAEDVTIQLGNVLCIRKRSRLVEPEILGAAEEWSRMLEELQHQEGDTIQH